MGDILFSTWAEDVIDNRGGSQAEAAERLAAKWPVILGCLVRLAREPLGHWR